MTQLTWLANFSWGIAADVLWDLYVRGKYRDVILPMTVLHRLDAVLEPTKQAVLNMRAALDRAGIANQDQALARPPHSANSPGGGRFGKTLVAGAPPAPRFT